MTIIECQGTEADSAHGFYFRCSKDATSVVYGFTITSGSTSSVGGISFNYSGPTTSDSTISGNTAGYWGSGIYCTETGREPECLDLILGLCNTSAK